MGRCTPPTYGRLTGFLLRHDFRSGVTLAPLACATATIKWDAHLSRAAFFSAA